MKKWLVIAAICLAANAWMVSSVKAFQNHGKAWLVIPSHYSSTGIYQPTVVRQFNDGKWYFASEQCAGELELIGNSVPWSLCTVSYDTVRLFTRLY